LLEEGEGSDRGKGVRLRTLGKGRRWRAEKNFSLREEEEATEKVHYITRKKRGGGRTGNREKPGSSLRKGQKPAGGGIPRNSRIGERDAFEGGRG